MANVVTDLGTLTWPGINPGFQNPNGLTTGNVAVRYFRVALDTAGSPQTLTTPALPYKRAMVVHCVLSSNHAAASPIGVVRFLTGGSTIADVTVGAAGFVHTAGDGPLAISTADNSVVQIDIVAITALTAVNGIVGIMFM